MLHRPLCVSKRLISSIVSPDDEFDWEVEHEHLAHQLESSRRTDTGIDDISNMQLGKGISYHSKCGQHYM